jgi:hypothetical protein
MEEITKAPALLSPYFSQYFILYTFTYDTTFVVVFTQKKNEGNEFPMAFMISGLQGSELHYLEVDKKRMLY